ncbi:MAG: double zinc ribbon domain-containing protein [Acidimicrobiia bacterium]
MGCPACGQVTRPGARFCPSCGAEFQTPCPSCGTPALLSAHFCDSCGGPVTGSVAPDNQRGPPTAPQPADHRAEGQPSVPASFAGGRYQIRGFLGEGGRKRVYAAYDTALHREVALATVKTEGLGPGPVRSHRHERLDPPGRRARGPAEGTYGRLKGTGGR